MTQYEAQPATAQAHVASHTQNHVVHSHTQTQMQSVPTVDTSRSSQAARTQIQSHQTTPDPCPLSQHVAPLSPLKYHGKCDVLLKLSYYICQLLIISVAEMVLYDKSFTF